MKLIKINLSQLTWVKVDIKLPHISFFLPNNLMSFAVQVPPDYLHIAPYVKANCPVYYPSLNL